MSVLYHCGGCDSRVALVNSGGVHRDIVCVRCNCCMDTDGTAKTEYVGDKNEYTDYQIATTDNEGEERV